MGVCGVGERGVLQVRGDRQGGLPAAGAGGRQGAAACGIFSVYHGQRPRRVSGFVIRNTGDLPERLAGPLHPYEFLFCGEYRSDETEARGVYWGGEWVFFGG